MPSTAAFLTLALSCLLLSAGAAAAAGLDLPQRDGPRPEATQGVPHQQIGAVPDPDLSNGLMRRVSQFPGVTFHQSPVSLPGAVGFILRPEMPIVQPQAIVAGREFAHVHPDGSLHATLDPAVVAEAVDAGWAVSHPWATERPGWEGLVLIYTPTTEDELDVVLSLIEHSYSYITGLPVP
ncbi:MAG: DUF5519 family protein [Paracoccaceae bacterium]|nr:DUF5519 family protein [Paracoccaceae bacterium]